MRTTRWVTGSIVSLLLASTSCGSGRSVDLFYLQTALDGYADAHSEIIRYKLADELTEQELDALDHMDWGQLDGDSLATDPLLRRVFEIGAFYMDDIDAQLAARDEMQGKPTRHRRIAMNELERGKPMPAPLWGATEPAVPPARDAFRADCTAEIVCATRYDDIEVAFDAVDKEIEERNTTPLCSDTSAPRVCTAAVIAMGSAA